MAVRNKLKKFVADKGITPYQLSKDTGLPLNTVYRLINNPSQVPSGDVMDVILSNYKGTTFTELLEHQSVKEAVA
jgi:predicted transcriptional regulator